MDRLQFQLTAFAAAGLFAALVGCSGDVSGDYHTFVEAQRSHRIDEAAQTIPADVPEADPSPGPTSSPLEPELAADEDEQAEDAYPVLAVAAAESSNIIQVDRAVSSENGANAVAPDAALASASAGSVRPTLGALNPPAASVSPTGGPVEAREIKLLIPHQTFQTEGPEGAIRVSYDDVNLLKILNMEPVPADAAKHFPEWLQSLEGRRIRIRGFMYPAFVESGLELFVLVRDNQQCCFGPGAKIYDHIEVRMREGVTTDYIQGRSFDVVGTFHIRPDADEEGLYQLFQIDDAVVID